MSLSKHKIKSDPENCTGCLRCKLICSFKHTGKFNPEQANIIIAEADQGVNSITFADKCESCGSCVRYCVYGALRFEMGD